MNGIDCFALVFMLLWGAAVLWICNKGFFRSEYSLSSLITDWPTDHPKEVFVWLGMSTIIFGLLCVLLFVPNSVSRLAEHHLTTVGTFIEYHGDHGNFSYHFNVQGSEYHGYDSTSESNLEQIEAGLPFKVYYNPSSPNINSVSEPIQRYIAGTIKVTLFTFVFIGLLAIVTRKVGILMRTGW